MTINIEYEAEKKLNLPYESIIEDVVNASLDYEKCPYEAEVNVILTDNAEIRRINREFRQIDSPTDVLSFPMGDFDVLLILNAWKSSLRIILTLRPGSFF